MYRVQKSSKIRTQISTFIESYLEKFIYLFSDTGIENEYLIQNNYREAAMNLKQSIILQIDKAFEPDFLAKRVSDAGELSVIIPVWNFRLFVDYTEDKEEEVRYIENIEFYKK